MAASCSASPASAACFLLHLIDKPAVSGLSPCNDAWHAQAGS